MSKLDNLRQQHRQLIYHGLSWQLRGQDLQLTFALELTPEINFQPQLTLKNFPLAQWPELQSAKSLVELSPPIMRLFFNLGLAEIPSYWKAACPAEVILHTPPGYTLSQAELAWWHDLLLNGLAEFFYQNQIDFTAVDFVSFKQTAMEVVTETINFDPQKIRQDFQIKTVADYLPQLKKGRLLVPVGGGKDSATVLAILEKAQLDYDILLLHPQSPAAGQIARRLRQEGHCQNIIELERSIDPQLLRLNQADYLNGHTPFSAYLAFAALTAAYFYGQQQVVLANEASADEENSIFHGQEINHQYSKSSAFEAKFQWYCQHFLLQNPPRSTSRTQTTPTTPQYFSLLRSMSELQITQLFCQLIKDQAALQPLLQEFRSCNVGQKAGVWCEHCPKCAFVFLMLSACLAPARVSPGIFQHNLLADKELFSTYRDLLGKGDKKPFECVGTFAESQEALLLSKQQYRQSQTTVPANMKKLLALLEK